MQQCWSIPGSRLWLFAGCAWLRTHAQGHSPGPGRPQVLQIYKQERPDPHHMNFSGQLLPSAMDQHHSSQRCGLACVMCPVWGYPPHCLTFHPLETSPEQEVGSARCHGRLSTFPSLTMGLCVHVCAHMHTPHKHIPHTSHTPHIHIIMYIANKQLHSCTYVLNIHMLTTHIMHSKHISHT